MIKTKEIYIVTSGTYEDYGIDKIFETRELAKEYIGDNDYYSIETHKMFMEDTQLETIQYYSIRRELGRNGEVIYEDGFEEVLNIESDWLNKAHAKLYYGGQTFSIGGSFIIKDKKDKIVSKIKEIMDNMYNSAYQLHNKGLLKHNTTIGNIEELKSIYTVGQLASDIQGQIDKLY